MRHGIRTSFLLQAAFILLPVLLLAAYGLFSLRREKQLLEEENRERCAVVLQSMARELSGQLGRLIDGYVAADSLQHVELRLAAGARRSDPPDLSSETIADVEVNQAGHLAQFTLENPDFRFDQQPFATVYSYEEKPILQLAKSGVPKVARWFMELSDEQRRQWQAIESAIAANRADEALQRINQFIGDSGEDDANTYAGFLRRQLSDPPLDEWLGSAAANNGDLSPAGLPLSGLAMYRALELHEAAPFDDATWDALARHFDQPPSVLTDALLARIGRRIAGEEPAAKERFDALNQLVDRHRRTAAIAELLAVEPADPGKPFQWVQLDHRDFLTITDFDGGSDTNRWLEQTFVPADWLIPKLKSVTADTAALLPEYVSVGLSVAGKTFPLRGDAPVNNSVPLLASSDFVLSGLTQRVGEVAELTAWLIDPGIMYRRHHQRVLIMGGLIGLAVIVALFGVWQTFANHRRQLALNEMKTNFVSSVSHELRAPIASVRLMAENLQQGKVSGEAKLKEYVGFIGQECRRLSSLIENVLDFSRIEQGRKQYELEPTDLTKLVEETVRLMRPYAEERNVTLSVEMEGRHSCRPDGTDDLGDRSFAVPIELNLDGRAIQQALINLIDNAIKHSPSGESVVISLIGRARLLPSPDPNNAPHGREPNTMSGSGAKLDVPVECVLLSVADHGPGIPLDEQSRIFERFYRRGSELRRETQGIGIGLSIVKHIVEGHGGRVRVESEPGRGSRFVVELEPQMDTDEKRPMTRGKLYE